MKQIWFESGYKDLIISGKLKRTFRELHEQKKDNAYNVGEKVLCRIHENGRFLLEQRIIKILNVELRKLNSLSDNEFFDSDASSKEDLKEKLKKYYKRDYSGEELIRIVDFGYIGSSSGSILDYAYSSLLPWLTYFLFNSQIINNNHYFSITIYYNYYFVNICCIYYIPKFNFYIKFWEI